MVCHARLTGSDSRARDAGFEGIVLTADCAVFGRRERELRHRFGVPMTLTPRMLWDIVRHPHWTLDILRHGVPRLENDVAVLREGWRGKMVLKGVLSPPMSLSLIEQE